MTVHGEPTAIVFVGSMTTDDVYQCTRFSTTTRRPGGRSHAWECECASFRLRRTCKHIGIAEDAAKGARFDGVRIDFVRNHG